MAPEILPFQFRLVETILRSVKKQEKRIDEAAADAKESDDRFYVNI